MNDPTSSENRPAPVRLLLADDHAIVRHGLAAVLKFEPRVAVVAEAADGAEAVAAYRTHAPDVAVLDVRMPGVDGLEAARRIRAEFPTARLLMLTVRDGEEDVRRALDAGAGGYVLKTASPDELVAAILAVHRGERSVPAALARRADSAAREPALSPRQLEVLELLASGLSNKEIARALGFTIDGAKAHLKIIYSRLGVRDRTEAVTTAVRIGLIRLD